MVSTQTEEELDLQIPFNLPTASIKDGGETYPTAFLALATAKGCEEPLMISEEDF